MKLTDEQLAEWATYGTPVTTLIAELREVRSDNESCQRAMEMLVKHVEHWKSNHHNVVAKLRLFTQREDLPVDRLPAYQYVLELERKLAESHARTAQILSVAERMRCAGGAQEFQHWFDELKSFLLRKQDTSALDAAIAAQEKP